MNLLRLAAALAIAATATSALAQPEPAPAPSSVREACRSSIMSLCAAEAMSGDRSAIRACLIKNLDKATPECQAAAKAAAAAQH